MHLGVTWALVQDPKPAWVGKMPGSSGTVRIHNISCVHTCILLMNIWAMSLSYAGIATHARPKAEADHPHGWQPLITTTEGRIPATPVLPLLHDVVKCRLRLTWTGKVHAVSEVNAELQRNLCFSAKDGVQCPENIPCLTSSPIWYCGSM